MVKCFTYFLFCFYIAKVKNFSPHHKGFRLFLLFFTVNKWLEAGFFATFAIYEEENYPYIPFDDGCPCHAGSAP